MLAPSTAAVAEILAGSFSSVVSLTAWSHGIVNTIPFPLTPKPDWFDGLSGEIQNLQTSAQTWIDTTGPQLGSAVPQSFLNYATMFHNASTDLIGVMQAIQQNTGNVPTAAQLGKLNAFLGKLLKQAQTEQATSQSSASSMTSFYTDVKASHKELASSIAAARGTLTGDEATIQALTSQISALQLKLAAVSEDAAAAMQSVNTKGASLAVSIVVFTLTTLAGGAGALLGIVGGLITLGVDAAESIKDNHEVLNDMQAIASLQQKLFAEEQQVAALEGVISNLDHLENLNTAASNVYTQLVPSIWEETASDLQEIIDFLKQAEVDVTNIDGLMQLDAAASRWSAIVTQANNIQDSSYPLGPTITLSDGGSGGQADHVGA